MHKPGHFDLVTNLNIAIPYHNDEIRVVIGNGASSKIINYSQNFGNKFLIITQSKIAELWLNSLQTSLRKIPHSVIKILNLPDGIILKDQKNLLAIYDCLQANEFSKTDTIIAFGGGDITDLSGFAASTYLRGLKLINIPTTLLGQIDASIGGKNGLNWHGCKNVIGTIYQPWLIIIDLKYLASLPSREFNAGMAEIVKYSLIEETISYETNYQMGPKSFYEVLTKLSYENFNNNHPSLKDIIINCLKMKLNTVAKDPYDQNIRHCLNLGHSFGHVFEALFSQDFNHGEAVSLGIIYAFKLSAYLNQNNVEHINQVTSLLQNFQLPIKLKANLSFTWDKFACVLKSDKKRSAHSLNFVLPLNKLGLVNYKYPLTLSQIEAFIKSVP